jgi:hypothetical protein
MLEGQPKIGDRAKGREIGIVNKRGSANFEYVQCPDCNQARWVAVGNLRLMKGSTRCYSCAAKVLRTTNKVFKRGPESFRWKGGRTVRKSGYISIVVEPEDPLVAMASLNVRRGTYHVLEHRYIMAKHLGRCLERGEVVHHVNGNRGDNRIENLRLHSLGAMIPPRSLRPKCEN